MDVIDLDILRPKPQIVKVGGKEIDISFVPCGITFELDANMSELSNLDQDKMKTDPGTQKKGFGLVVKRCAIYCEHKYPDMNEKWFLDNCSVEQINAFAEAIRNALIKSYGDIAAHSKN